MSRLLRHVRANAVGYLALTVALTGTSYAAISPGANTVGAPQLKIHSIDPVKFDSHVIGGFVRHWVHVSATGRVLGGSGPVRVSYGAATYQISWRDSVDADRSSHCMPVVTVDAPQGQVPAAGPAAATVADASVFRSPSRRATNVVVTTGNAGLAAAGSFYLALICS